MLPVLPREMLWTELKTMDEFFQLDPVNEEFHDVLMSLSDEFFSFTRDAEKVFNEVYYQLTKMVFRHPMPSELDKYASEIKSDLGWSYSATLVMSMAYFLYDLSDLDSRALNKHFLKSIRDAYGGPMYWMPFKKLAEKLKRKKVKLEYQFRPQPLSATEFATLYVDWSAITWRYQLSCIEHVLNLWCVMEDKETIANMIMESMSCSVLYHPQGMECEQVRRYLNKYIGDRKEEHVAWKARQAAMYAQSEQRKQQFEQEKRALLGKIAEQDAEIARLNTLLSDKKNEGKERRFTLVQIIDYCKNACPDYQSAFPIEHMLLSLLCSEATTEEHELIKSIPDHFREKLYGNIKVEKVEQLNAVLGKDAKIQK